MPRSALPRRLAEMGSVTDRDGASELPRLRARSDAAGPASRYVACTLSADILSVPAVLAPLGVYGGDRPGAPRRDWRPSPFMQRVRVCDRDG
jgi:hypothetical protein